MNKERDKTGSEYSQYSRWFVMLGEGRQRILKELLDLDPPTKPNQAKSGCSVKSECHVINEYIF